jgi:hypothetical protein
MHNTIKEAIKQIFADDADGVTFLPANGDLTKLDIKGFKYSKKSKYETSNLGHLYHIMIYKCDDDGMITHPDNFVATLTDPYVYVSSIIECGFYGVVTRKTKASNKFMKEMFSGLLKSTVMSPLYANQKT